MNGAEAARRVKQLGREAGFEFVRITSAAPLDQARDRYIEWVDAGRQGAMAWIDHERARRSADPSFVLEGSRSVICVGLSYWSGHRPAEDGRTGAVARYAWGLDYHVAIEQRLRSLAGTLVKEIGGEHRWYVDTGPLMDKALADRSGVGWYGKNSNILTEELGSFVLLGEIVTSLDLPPDRPVNRDCGSCRLCVVACPTGAIGPEHSVDSRKCISYLTIEHRGPLPLELRPLMGGWVFGCDICQDVCPPSMQPHLDTEQRVAWARQVRSLVKDAVVANSAGVSLGTPPDSMPGHPLFSQGIRPSLDLLWLLRLSHAEYLEAFKSSSIRRAKVWMLRRNAAVALGNVGGADAVEPLICALLEDEEPIVRGHAAWALGRVCERLGIPNRARGRLESALRDEQSEYVREEIIQALTMVRPACSIREIRTKEERVDGESGEQRHDRSAH